MFKLYCQSISSTQLTIIFHLSIINYEIECPLEVLSFQIMQGQLDPLRLIIKLKIFHLSLSHLSHLHFRLFKIVFLQYFQICQLLFFLHILFLHQSQKNHLFYDLALHYWQDLIFIDFLFARILFLLF